ncbi:MAG: hypothetical protein NUV37_00320 [Nanoarchaeota archaeon]|nr:hypothetical protein [Nanoarchaeota archaeon]
MIKNLLLKYNWTEKTIKEVFSELNKESKKIITKKDVGNKVKTFAYLDKSIIDSLEKRAVKNLFTLNEQIEDILRRSVVNQKKRPSKITDNIDDKLLTIFSRKNTGPKKR